ncbi:MAG: DUF4190 domain-containing protein [Actinobacteria bacterium]|nr:DUF4190 domain-containing protein [Actinomycetota bacterium]
MYCRQCGSKIRPGDSFCPQCGVEVNLDIPVEEIAGGRTPPPPIPPPVSSARQAGRRKTSGWAVVSLVVGALSFLFFPVLGSILAIVFAIIAKKEIKEGNGGISGSGMATAGLVLGIIGLVIPLILVIIAVPVFHAFVLPQFEARYNIVKGVEAAHAYYIDNDRSYRGLDADELSDIDSETTYEDGSGNEPGVVYIKVITADMVMLQTVSKTGTKYIATASRDNWDFSFAMTDDEYEFWKEFKNWYPFD